MRLQSEGCSAKAQGLVTLRMQRNNIGKLLFGINLVRILVNRLFTRFYQTQV